jgi:hypothetical protein
VVAMTVEGRYRGMTAPGGGGDPTRFATMFEVNPWVPQDYLEKVPLYRGAIVAARGYSETWLSEIALRASFLDEYRSFRDTVPYPLEKRLAFLERVLNSPGPMAEFASFGLHLN